MYLVQAPSSPSVTLLPLNSTSVQVSWMKGNVTDEVDNVTVEYLYAGQCSCSDQDRCQLSRFITNTSAIFSNLQEYSPYTFTIIAFNQAGRSFPTNKGLITYPSS